MSAPQSTTSDPVDKMKYWRWVNKLAEELRLERTRTGSATVNVSEVLDSKALLDFWSSTRKLRSPYFPEEKGEVLEIEKPDNQSYRLTWNDHAMFTAWTVELIKGMLEQGFLVQKGDGLNLHFEPTHLSEFKGKDK